jgi:uncharacterized protein (DUF3084 family)
MEDKNGLSSELQEPQEYLKQMAEQIQLLGEEQIRLKALKSQVEAEREEIRSELEATKEELRLGQEKIQSLEANSSGNLTSAFFLTWKWRYYCPKMKL